MAEKLTSRRFHAIPKKVLSFANSGLSHQQGSELQFEIQLLRKVGYARLKCSFRL
jgi:hypothetical protein